MEVTLQTLRVGHFARIDDRKHPAGWYRITATDLSGGASSAEPLSGSIEFIAKDIGPVWADIYYVLATAERAPADPGQAADDVLFERSRQVEQERFTPAHDDMEHSGRELGRAAACYMAHPDLDMVPPVLIPAGYPALWPWSPDWWKPGGDDLASYRRRLVKGAALAIAEIERVDRLIAAGGKHV